MQYRARREESGGAGAWFDGEFVAAPKVKAIDTTAASVVLFL